MIRAEYGNTLVIVEAATQLPDGQRAVEQVLRGAAAQRADVLRTDQLQLTVEKTTAVVDLKGQRRSVPRRTTFQHIGNVDLLTPQTDGPQQIVEHLSGGADERLARSVLVRTRRFTQEVNLRVQRPHAEDR